MKAFVVLVVLFLIVFLIASTSLANVDLTPDTPAVASGFSAQAAEPQVINIQNSAPASQILPNGSVPVTGALQSSSPVSCTDPYTIQPGDMLSGIADLCNTTVAEIRLANPQITNINMIYPGQQIRVPGAPAVAGGTLPEAGGTLPTAPQAAAPTLPASNAAPQVAIPQIASPEASAPALVPVTTPVATDTPAAQVPVTGPFPVIKTGTVLQVKAMYYPPNTVVNIAIGPQTVGYNIIATGITDQSGNLVTRVTVPTAPDSQTPWVVVVATTGKPPVQAMSNPFFINPNQ